MAFQRSGNTLISATRTMSLAQFNVTQDTGVIQVLSAPPAVGTVAAYTSGGQTVPSYTSKVEKYPFATDTNATSIGNLNYARRDMSGHSSATASFTANGYNGPSQFEVIEQFPFATALPATSFNVGITLSNFGNPTFNRAYFSDSAGLSSPTYGFIAGGWRSNSATSSPLFSQKYSSLHRFAFSHTYGSTSAYDIGYGMANRVKGAAISSPAKGYVAGGTYSTSNDSTYANGQIRNAPFASDANATLGGYLATGRTSVSGGGSTVSGYVFGGVTTIPGTIASSVERFPFATDTNATSLGNLATTISELGPTSSTSSSHFYIAGGATTYAPPAVYVATITKYPFSSETSAFSVGNLTTPTYGHTNTQD